MTEHEVEARLCGIREIHGAEGEPEGRNQDELYRDGKDEMEVTALEEPLVLLVGVSREGLDCIHTDLFHAMSRIPHYLHE